MADEIATLDKNLTPCLLGIDPNGDIKEVTCDNNGVFGAGTAYPVTGNEVAKRDLNQNPCALVKNNNGYLINLRLNSNGKIIA